MACDRKSNLVTMNLAIPSDWGIFRAVNDVNTPMDGFFHAWEETKTFYDYLNLNPELDNLPYCLL